MDMVIPVATMEKLSNIKMLKVSLVAYVLTVIVSGQGDALGPHYSLSSHACNSESECNGSLGETCLWLYEGCTQGRCMCDPRVHIQDSNGKCRQIAKGGDYCESHDDCLEGMECYDKECVCKYGRRMTPDRRACLRHSEKLLGSACNPSKDTCLQKPPYSLTYTTNMEVVCTSRGLCACSEGLKQDGLTCRKWEIGETGCTKQYHCQGGAVCLEGRCDCPNDYKVVSDYSKCARTGAVSGLTIGETCNEESETRYCAAGLVCYQCATNQAFQCVKFLITDDQYPFTSTASTLRTSTLVSLLLSATVMLLFSPQYITSQVITHASHRT